MALKNEKVQFSALPKIINAEKRYVLVDLEGKIIDDANGYGYLTANNAYKSGWWKFNREDVENKKEAKEFWKNHPGKQEEVLNFLEEISIYALKDGIILSKEDSVKAIFKDFQLVVKEAWLEYL